MARQSIRISDWYDESAEVAEMVRVAKVEGAKVYRIISEDAPELGRMSLEDAFYGTTDDAVGQARIRAMTSLKTDAFAIWDAYTDAYEATADGADADNASAE